MNKFVFSFSESGSLTVDSIKKITDFENLYDNKNNNILKSLLGGKGFYLANMTNMGLPIPAGFTITTQACQDYYKNNKTLSSEILSEIKENIIKLEHVSNKKFVSPDQDSKDIMPLLVSVRSGAKISMPGMMDTILNLGLNDNSAQKLVNITKNKEFVWDTYARFIQMFSSIVKNVPKSEFIKIESNDYDFLTKSKIYKKIYEKFTNTSFPENPYEQLHEAVKAIFDSWHNPRAKFYRKMNKITEDGGTAVNVQMMVFGNMGDDSGTGVAFSRNPITGEKKIFGEYLINAQGEDVVAGIRTPEPIGKLQLKMPDIYAKFEDITQKLESEYHDMQDMEFTIENKKLFMLQTRSGKRSAQAAIKIAVDLVRENKITKQEAIMRIKPEQIDFFMHSGFDQETLENLKPISKGLAASPGAAVGRVVFNASEAKQWVANGEKVILVRQETSPEDIEGMQTAEGILTARGGMTSHAAVVARGMGRCCVVGCEQINIANDCFYVDNTKISKGDVISIDGSTGNIYSGSIKTSYNKISPEFNIFMGWVDMYKKLTVYANADSSIDIKKALELGAEGVGLCRTEHMFFKKNRINIIRKMIISDTKKDRQDALDELFMFQKEDFIKMFLEIKNLPLVIRLLDPPLHEFLPESNELQAEISRDLHISLRDLKTKISQLHEVNPMMGHRGCRLFISYPEIAEMQVKAIITAALEVQNILKNIEIIPEIMIPLVGNIKEIKFIKNIINNTANIIINNKKLKYKIGTMIELPRAVIIADKLAEESDFFSFGTNDLTQMTFGFSRDDASKFLKNYYENNIYDSDPFEHIDESGVGELISLGSKLGKQQKSSLKIGVCGEHGGDPISIKFFDKLNLDYISCSPFRIPVAKLAAAQANINRSKV
ncbi:MAG: pyruvate, phosphate dikinase [Candidatus Improbicoccus devescovinae]|nr:MAG: pyruvate, phosphate dikinase [Candidatus Improbicoccus devescovinae]